jgi:hypothetical protein
MVVEDLTANLGPGQSIGTGFQRFQDLLRILVTQFVAENLGGGSLAIISDCQSGFQVGRFDGDGAVHQGLVKGQSKRVGFRAGCHHSQHARSRVGQARVLSLP